MVMEVIMQYNNYVLSTKGMLIAWYRSQLKKFLKLGIGKITENNVVVGDKLLSATRKRIIQLGGKAALHPDWGLVKERKPSKNPSAVRVRKFRDRQAKLKESGHEHITTTVKPRSKSNSAFRHERDKA